MPRVKRGKVRARKRKALLIHAKGFKWRRKNVYRLSKEAVSHAWMKMRGGRMQRRRDMRKLWIIQINAATRQSGMSYSQFINGLKEHNIGLNRKQLSQIANANPEHFQKILEQVKK